MPYFRTCPHCGSNLDPGEKCDCQREKAKAEPIKRKPQRRAAATIKTRASTDRPLVLEARRKNA